MRPRAGFTLIEMLVAVGIAVTVIGAAVLTLRQGARGLSSEQEVVLSNDQAARALQGITAELKGQAASFLLPGASSAGVGLVVLNGKGWPVVPEGYSSTRIRFIADNVELRAGDPAVLLGSNGTAFYIPALEEVVQVDAARSIWEARLAGCSNPVAWSDNMRLYRSDLLTLARSSGGIRLSRSGGGERNVLNLADFSFGFVYTTPTSEEVSDTYAGPGRSDGARLSALAFQAVGQTSARRAFTARIPIGGGNLVVRQVRTCGDTVLPPGSGALTVVILPPPPGGGDVDVIARGFSQTISTTTQFRSLEGGWSITAREVTRGREIWTPNLTTAQGQLYSFAPSTITVTYTLARGTVNVNVSPSFSGQIQLGGLPGNPVINVTTSNPSVQLDVPPGTYTISPTPVVNGDSLYNCLTRYQYTGGGVPLDVYSRGVYTVDLQYRPTSGCLDVTAIDGSGGGLQHLNPKVIFRRNQ